MHSANHVVPIEKYRLTSAATLQAWLEAISTDLLHCDLGQYKDECSFTTDGKFLFPLTTRPPDVTNLASTTTIADGTSASSDDASTPAPASQGKKNC